MNSFPGARSRVERNERVHVANRVTMLARPAVATLGLMLLVGQASAEDAKPIHIPAITPLTGPVANIGQDVKKGLDVAEELLNQAGGIAGRKVVVDLVDTQSKPEIVRREMERLAGLVNAPVILGCESSGGTSTAAQFAERAGVPLVNGLASVDMSDRNYKWYFSQQVTNEDFAAAAVDFVEDISGSKGLSGVRIALLNEDSPNGAGTADRIKKILEKKNISPVAAVSYSREERNLLPLIKKLQESKPDFVYWSGYTGDVVAGLSAMQQLDFYPYVVGIGGGTSDPRLSTLVDPEILAKIHLANVDYFNVNLKRAKPFVDAYRAKFSSDPSSYASSCFPALFTVKAAIEATNPGTHEPNRQDIAAALRKLNIPGDQTITPAKDVRFNAQGYNAGAQAIVSQWRGVDRGRVVVWPTEFATEPSTKLP